jgi:hypothetical protein
MKVLAFADNHRPLSYHVRLPGASPKEENVVNLF